MTLGPIDYSGGAQPLNPMQRGMQAFALGDALRQKQLAEQAAQQKQMQDALLQEELAALASRPGGGTVQDYAATITRYPHLAEKLKVPMEAMSLDQQRQALGHSLQALSALDKKKPDIAARLYDEYATAKENSGDTQGAAKSRAMAEQIRANPEAAKAILAGMALSLNGGKDAVEGMTKLNTDARAQDLHGPAVRTAIAGATTAEAKAAEAPAQEQAATRTAIAGATTAEVAAKYANSKALLDLEQQGWNIKALKADIEFKRESNRIASMNAAFNREGNVLKRQELQLKIDDTIKARDEKVLQKAASFESARSGVEDIYTQIRRIKEHPGLDAAVGLSSWWAAVPGTDARSAANEIEKLIAMVAAGNLEKLKGPMSDKDIIFLKAIGSNLDRKQSMQFLLPELNRLENWAVDKDIKLRKEFGLPAGGASTPAVSPKPATADVPAPAGAQRNIVVSF